MWLQPLTQGIHSLTLSLTAALYWEQSVWCSDVCHCIGYTHTHTHIHTHTHTEWQHEDGVSADDRRWSTPTQGQAWGWVHTSANKLHPLPSPAHVPSHPLHTVQRVHAWAIYWSWPMPLHTPHTHTHTHTQILFKVIWRVHFEYYTLSLASTRLVSNSNRPHPPAQHPEYRSHDSQWLRVSTCPLCSVVNSHPTMCVCLTLSPVHRSSLQMKCFISCDLHQSQTASGCSVRCVDWQVWCEVCGWLGVHGSRIKQVNCYKITDWLVK